MLVSKAKTFSARDVVNLKFSNGEEILGRFVSSTDTTITITHPVIMQLVPVGNGQGAVQFAPFLLGREDSEEYTIDLDKLMVHPGLARSDAASQYMKATSSIELVDSSSSLIV